MMLSLFRGGIAQTEPSEIIESFDAFCDLVTQVQPGIKNGDYFVRGLCSGSRCDEAITSISMIIIDGDQTLSDGSSCTPPQPVHELLKSKNITHVIYNSYSNDLVNNRHKWRVCIPCDDITDSADLAAGVAEIISLLHANGIPVKNVKENAVLSQPWFTPRCPEHLVDDFYSAYHDGEKYRLGSHIILESAAYGEPAKQDAGTGNHFSWDYVMGEFRRGTLHMGLKAAAGWLVRTTDWADIQVISHLSALVEATCPDKDKVARAKSGEIAELVKYCRQKSGVFVGDIDISWRANCKTAAELRETEFPPVKWVVDKLIPEGLIILAGDPKCGKSLMAVDICSAIASGSMAFGGRECVAGGVIYVSLEDPHRRVKERIMRQSDIWPDTFRIVTGGVTLPFSSMIDDMIMSYPDTRCIVVDTMQYIVPDKPNNVSDYNHYYSVLGPIHDIALKLQISVILITHKTKTQAANGDNPFAGIIGSVAIQGTADAMMLLSKNHAKGNLLNPELADGFLHVIGREVESDCFPLEFDSERLVWSMAGEKKETATGNANWLLIADQLKKKKMTPKELSASTHLNGSTVKSCLRRMNDKGIVCSNNGIWEVVRHDYSATMQW